MEIDIDHFAVSLRLGLIVASAMVAMTGRRSGRGILDWLSINLDLILVNTITCAATLLVISPVNEFSWANLQLARFTSTIDIARMSLAPAALIWGVAAYINGTPNLHRLDWQYRIASLQTAQFCLTLIVYTSTQILFDATGL